MIQAAAKTSSGLEIELKFELTHDLVRTLSRAAPFKGLWVEPARRKSLRATYFDTPDLQLAQRGLSLRVRKESNQYVQCFKAKPEGGCADGFARLEWEWKVPGPALDAAHLSRDKVIEERLKGIDLRQIQPLFSTDIKRQTRLLETPGGARIRYDLDQGRILAGDREVPIYELELELESGPVCDLLKLAQSLTAVVPTRLSSRTKAQRGQHLAFGTKGRWVKARPLTLTSSATAHDVLCASVEEGLKHLIANEDCVLLDCHIEGVHQMRVALRRMRAAITTYKKWLPVGCYEDLSSHLKMAGSVLGPARDLDVFLNEILPGLESGLESPSALNILRTKAQKRREASYARVRQFIHSADYAQLLTDALFWVGTTPWVVLGKNPLAVSATSTAATVLARHQKKLFKLGKGLDKMPSEQRHQLRIAIKKARYAAEFFEPLFQKKQAGPYLRRLRALQDGLGHMNDLATAQHLMADFSRGAQGQNAQALNRAGGLVEGWYSHAQKSREDGLLAAWAAFTKGKVFWGN